MAESRTVNALVGLLGQPVRKGKMSYQSEMDDAAVAALLMVGAAVVVALTLGVMLWLWLL